MKKLPFIVDKLLEMERGDVYTVDERDLMADIRRALQDFILAEEKAAEEAEFAATYPEHMKLDKVRIERQAIGEFIDHGGWILTKWPDDSQYPIATNMSINEVLAEYYEIDMKVLEQEKQAMLEKLAKANA